MRAIKLGKASTEAPIKLGTKTVEVPLKKSPAILFEDAPDDRIGFYVAKQEIEITRYRIPFRVAKGQKVEVTEDKGDRVLVHLNQTSTIYCDSDQFFRDFERAK